MIAPALADSGAAEDFLARCCLAIPGFYLDFRDLCLFWTITQRLMAMYPRRRELCEDGDFGTFQRDWKTVCTADLR